MDDFELTNNGEVVTVPLDPAEATPRRLQSALPPTDEGVQAWLCLAGGFLSNALIWGFAFSYGTLQEYYSTHEPFASHPAGLAAVGTTATGLAYLSMPIYFIVYRNWPRARSWSLRVSVPLVAAALIGASFSDTVPQLIACEGVLFSLAGNALVVPTISYLDEWWVRRKGLAVGIMWAGDGTGGVIMPLLMGAMLDRFGFRWTLRVIAGMIVILTIPLHFLKPRIPISATSTRRPTDVRFLKTKLFWGLQVFNVIQGLGYFLPSNYLPSYAESLGVDPIFSSITILLINLASVFGCVGVGFLVDRFDVTAVLACVSTLATIAVLAFWGFSTSAAPLCVFCVAYGLTAGGYSSSWGGMVQEVKRKQEGADTSILFGFLAAGRGIGAIVSGPLSEVLLSGRHNMYFNTGSAYQSSYAGIIVFSGCTAFIGGCSWVLRSARLI